MQIYTGNSDNILVGTEIDSTEIESIKYFATEYIRTRVYIVLEVNKKNYFFTGNEFKDLNDDAFEISNLDEFEKIYTIEKVKKKKRVNLVEETQILFLHLLFDGKVLISKNIQIEQIKNKDN